MKKYLISLLFVFLTACNLNLQYRSVPQAWIDAPLNGMVLPLAAYDIVAHASDPTGISQIEVSVDGSVVGMIPGSGVLFTGTQAWTPPAPGEYMIRARGMNSGGDWSEYAEAKITVQGEVVSTLPPVTATLTSTPTSALTATPSIPTLILNKNGNCRRGPGQVYEVLTSLLAGQQVPIVGRNEDETWWFVRIPTGELCWISRVTGDAQGNTSIVPVESAPPTPQQACLVYDPNQQPVCTLPCPPNAQPGDACTP